MSSRDVACYVRCDDNVEAGTAEQRLKANRGFVGRMRFRLYCREYRCTARAWTLAPTFSPRRVCLNLAGWLLDRRSPVPVASSPGSGRFGREDRLLECVPQNIHRVVGRAPAGLRHRTTVVCLGEHL